MEQEAKKRTRKKKQQGAVMLKITIQSEETVLERKVEWLKQADGGVYGDVDHEIPTTRTVTILEQSVPSDGFDLAKVIKAINGL